MVRWSGVVFSNSHSSVAGLEVAAQQFEIEHSHLSATLRSSDDPLLLVYPSGRESVGLLHSYLESSPAAAELFNIWDNLERVCVWYELSTADLNEHRNRQQLLHLLCMIYLVPCLK